MLFLTILAYGKEYHVSLKGSNTNEGTASRPFKTISFAAQIAQPGDIITVHEGTYRERITPKRGGTSDKKRIIYRAAKNEKVEIKGSELITDWKKVEGNVWKVTIPNEFFGKYNPYKDLIVGDWYVSLGRKNHTGEIYLNGKSLYEADSLKKVFKPIRVVNRIMLNSSTDLEGATYTWYTESNDNEITIYANFHNYNPNKERVEINVRESCFYPAESGINYITVSGFHLSQAATQWAAPTAEQIGLIGTNWSKGWIIENNEISDSKCVGITLGKDRKSGHNVWTKNPSKDGSDLYNEVALKVIQNGWNKDNIGSHIVRNNTIFNCGVAGICGSFGAAFSQITNNHIYDIWTKRLFTGPEKGGIKIHAAIDIVIKGNHIHNTHEAIWLDWMAQGTRISGNLCYNNDKEDFYAEVDHGPYLVDNNLFLSETAMWDMSEGGAYVHNLIAGKIYCDPQLGRKTPYFKPHSTILVDVKNIPGGDDRFYNNIFTSNDSTFIPYTIPKVWGGHIGYGLEIYNDAVLPIHTDGNIYMHGALPFKNESNFIRDDNFDPSIKLTKESKNVFLSITFKESIKSNKNKLVTTELLGKTIVTDGRFENPDGSPLKIDTDYFGNKRSKTNPSSGPFEDPGNIRLGIVVWTFSDLNKVIVKKRCEFSKF